MTQPRITPSEVEVAEAAKTLLPNFIRPGAVILVKASRGMAFEELTRELQQLTRKT